MTDLQTFKEKVIEKFCSNITDNVFLMIQNDKELMQEYLHLIESNKLKIINSQIAKEVKKRFHLDNRHQKTKKPHSMLIKSFEEFETD